MPFICLTRDDVPDGIVQILDLKPNVSQRVPSLDAPGQTRYVNRVQRDPVLISPVTGKVLGDSKGLAAYIADRVQPGGVSQASASIESVLPVDGDTVTIAGVAFTCVDNFATGSVQMNTPAIADTVTIAGVVFEAAAAENIPLLQFDQSGAVGAQATSLAACIMGAAAQAAFLAANPAVGVRPAMSVTVDSAVGDTVNFSCSVRGIDGGPLGIVVAEAVPGTMVPSGATFTWVAADTTAAEFQGFLGVVGHTDDEVALSLTASINDVTPVTGGQALLIAAIAHLGETIAAAAALHEVTLTYSAIGAFGLVPTLVTSSAVRLPITTTLTGHLGFAVQIPTQAQYATVANALIARLDAGLPLAAANINTVLTATFGATSLNTGGSTARVEDFLEIMSGGGYVLGGGSQKFVSGVWDSTEHGSFDRTVLTFGNEMQSGEWVPHVIGGDPTDYEHKPIRYTFDGTSFQLSLNAGALNKFAAGVTLFPWNAVWAYHATQHQPGVNPHPQVAHARLVTVYDDDGTVLA